MRTLTEEASALSRWDFAARTACESSASQGPNLLDFPYDCVGRLEAIDAIWPLSVRGAVLRALAKVAACGQHVRESPDTAGKGHADMARAHSRSYG